MKNLHIFILLTTIFLVSCTGNSQNKLKRYDVKSGIVQYKTTISGNIMGSKITGSGTESLYFKDWGALELKEEKSKKTTHINVFGMKKTQTDETHTIDKLDNGKSYSVDFDEKVIYVKDDDAMQMMKQTGTDAGEAGKNMLEAMGGKKTGNEKVLGYDCEVWSMPGGKQWIYKGVLLKIDMKIMGTRTLTEAVSADFNVSVPDSKFELPDFPVQNIDELMQGGKPNTHKEIPADVKEKRKAEYLNKMQNL